MKNIPNQPAQLTKWVLAGFAAFFLTACGSGSDNDPPAVSIPDDFVPVQPDEPDDEEPVAEPVSFVVFDGEENPNWVAWDCCGGTDPGLVTDDGRGDVMRFNIGADPAVVGFISRIEDGAANDEPFDASGIADNGTLSFDLKMTASPGEDVQWFLKLESDRAATAVEVNLNTSIEGHAGPELDTWQTYTFNLSDLADGGLDLSQIDVVMVFPAWGQGEGAEFLIDEVVFEGGDAPAEEPVQFTIFEEEVNPNWVPWDCCGGTEPAVVVDDEEHGNVVEFSLGADPAVLGFISRVEDGAAEDEPFDASGIADNGTLSFDLKMTASPGEDVQWFLKLESDRAATAVEVNLNTSIEGHAGPELDTWQTYTFNLSDLADGGLDLSQIDVVMVFPAWGQGEGAEYRLDNVSFQEEAPAVDPTALLIFEEEVNPNWVPWDCCGGTDPGVIADDEAHGNVVQFSVGADPTVLGFISRVEDGAAEDAPFDGSGIAETGAIAFDLKMTASPGDSVQWFFKAESDRASTAAEVNVSTSIEGHAAPELDTWQTYTFRLSDLADAGLDLSLIDVIMVFPAWGQGDGAEYLVDNVKFLNTYE